MHSDSSRLVLRTRVLRTRVPKTNSSYTILILQLPDLSVQWHSTGKHARILDTLASSLAKRGGLSAPQIRWHAISKVPKPESGKLVLTQNF